jgi:hypothetical protein
MKRRSVDRLWFAVPGDIETRTGGTIYDKKVLAELRRLGWLVEHLEWPASFPFPSTADIDTVAASLGACPDGALVMIDGLAFSVLPDVISAEAERLRLVALVHHPLALESGLPPDIAKRFRMSERQALTHARAVIVTSEMTPRSRWRRPASTSPIHSEPAPSTPYPSCWLSAPCRRARLSTSWSTRWPASPI